MNIDDIAKIEQQCFSNPWTSEMLESELYSPLSVLVCEELDGRAAAFALGRVAADEGEVFRIGTLPEYRRKGIAEKLLGELIRKMKVKGASVCFLEVKSTNVPARELYRKSGFEDVYVRKNYYPDDDAVVMRKEL